MDRWIDWDEGAFFFFLFGLRDWGKGKLKKKKSGSLTLFFFLVEEMGLYSLMPLNYLYLIWSTEIALCLILFFSMPLMVMGILGYVSLAWSKVASSRNFCLLEIGISL